MDTTGLQETRTVEKYDVNTATFTPINWEDLDIGMCFRVIEEDGEIVDKGTKYEICIVVEKPVKDNGYWCVGCEPIIY